MSKQNKCPKCNGLGVLRDATQGWDVGQAPPGCDLCGGEGTWLATQKILDEHCACNKQASINFAYVYKTLEAVAHSIAPDFIGTWQGRVELVNKAMRGEIETPARAKIKKLEARVKELEENWRLCAATWLRATADTADAEGLTSPEQVDIMIKLAETIESEAAALAKEKA